MKKGIIVLLLLTVLLAIPTLNVLGADKVNVEALMRETVRTLEENKESGMLWWMPEEMWSAVLSDGEAQTPEVEAATESMLKIFRPYNVFLINSGKSGFLGVIKYKTEKEIRSSIILRDVQGSTCTPLMQSELDPRLIDFMNLFKEVMSQGGLRYRRFSKNSFFMVFPGRSQDGQQLIDPRGMGSFTVQLEEKLFRWDLPLKSLPPLPAPAAAAEATPPPA